MIMIPMLKYCFVALAISVGAWTQGGDGTLLVGGLVGLFAGLFVVAVVMDRDTSLPTTSSTSTAALCQDQVKAFPRLKRTLIVGSGMVARTLAESLTADGGYQVIGFVDDCPPSAGDRWPILGHREATAAIVQRYSIDEVLLAYAPTWQQTLVDELMAYGPEVSVRVVPTPYEALMRLSSVESMGDIALVRLAHSTGRVRQVIKRAFDFTAAFFGLLLLAPATAFVALLVKLTSRGPIIFAQERIGQHGKPFVLYKFRTMRHNAEAETGPVLSSGKDDDRLTPIGRWLKLTRMDEVPQLWNVLQGTMSLVGPRPERAFFVREFERINPSYAKRHQVRPGITGLAQVSGGYHTDARDKLRFDLIYISHQSLWLDVSILVRTVSVIFRRNRH